MGFWFCWFCRGCVCKPCLKGHICNIRGGRWGALEPCRTFQPAFRLPFSLWKRNSSRLANGIYLPGVEKKKVFQGWWVKSSHWECLDQVEQWVSFGKYKGPFLPLLISTFKWFFELKLNLLRFYFSWSLSTWKLIFLHITPIFTLLIWILPSGSPKSWTGNECIVVGLSNTYWKKGKILFIIDWFGFSENSCPVLHSFFCLCGCLAGLQGCPQLAGFPWNAAEAALWDAGKVTCAPAFNTTHLPELLSPDLWHKLL